MVKKHQSVGKVMGKNGFTMYAKAAVVYEGRAYSTLETGNYLIVYKPDGSFMVHGGKFIPALNYQGPKSLLRFHRPGTPTYRELYEQHFRDLCTQRPELILESASRKECLYVAVLAVINQQLLISWSATSIKLSRSEAELRDHIVTNIRRYFPGLRVLQVETEVPTPYGNVDILITARDGLLHIIEVKRRQASIAACGQIARYARHLVEVDGQCVREYIAAPTISRNAQVYCTRHGQRYIEATFPTK